MEMIKIFNIPCKSNHKVFQLDCYLSRIKYLEKFQDTSSLINDLLSIDDQILEKKFLNVLYTFFKNKNILEFLMSKTEEEARDLIDGLFDNENDENITIELRDIEILINCVCFVHELQMKKDNADKFIQNFHIIINKEIYKEIEYHIEHIEIKKQDLKYFLI